MAKWEVRSFVTFEAENDCIACAEEMVMLQRGTKIAHHPTPLYIVGIVHDRTLYQGGTNKPCERHAITEAEEEESDGDDIERA